MMLYNIDDEWDKYMNDNIDITKEIDTKTDVPPCPTAGELRISTKVKVIKLNVDDIDIYNLYWELPVIRYWMMKNGIIKKQINIM